MFETLCSREMLLLLLLVLIVLLLVVRDSENRGTGGRCCRCGNRGCWNSVVEVGAELA